MTDIVAGSIAAVGRGLVDFALPPRCSGCGDIIDEVGAFCSACWSQVAWLGNSGCVRCGLPLAGTEVDTCGRCMTDPPKLGRIRAAVAYDEVSRSIALRLKYGRKIGLARTMARYMAPLRGDWDGDAVLVPVPLHRWRLWGRGFNQAGLVANELARMWTLAVEPNVLRRIKRTRPLKGLSQTQRRRTVAAAFKVPFADRVAGRSIVLIDDVFTTGSTAEACCGALLAAGAARVDLVCWARVVRPSQLMR